MKQFGPVHMANLLKIKQGQRENLFQISLNSIEGACS